MLIRDDKNQAEEHFDLFFDAVVEPLLNRIVFSGSEATGFGLFKRDYDVVRAMRESEDKVPENFSDGQKSILKKARLGFERLIFSTETDMRTLIFSRVFVG